MRLADSSTFDTILLVGGNYFGTKPLNTLSQIKNLTKKPSIPLLKLFMDPQINTPTIAFAPLLLEREGSFI